MDMIRGGNAKHHHHQTPVYRAVADKTPFRVSLAGVFPHQHMTVEHRLSRQQRQTPVTDVGFVLRSFPSSAWECASGSSASQTAREQELPRHGFPSGAWEPAWRSELGNQPRYARSQAPLGNAVLEALLPRQPGSRSFQAMGSQVELGNQRGGRSLGTSHVTLVPKLRLGMRYWKLCFPTTGSRSFQDTGSQVELGNQRQGRSLGTSVEAGA